MLVVGLTGNIGSGKSTVANILRSLGAKVIDTDQVAREVVEPGTPGLKAIVDAFGQEVLNQDGSLNRSRMAQIVFSDPDARARLNAIVHPAIRQVILHEISTYKETITSGDRAGVNESAPLLVIEAPLLIETGLHELVNEVWLVTVDLPNQIARTTRRDDATAEQIRQRLAAQMPQEDKIPYAHRIIDNSGSLEQTRQQVLDTWNQSINTT